MLTNAIYFKAEWETKFYREATREGAFQVTGQRKVNVPTDARHGDLQYLDGGTFKMLELPYKEKELSMLSSAKEGGRPGRVREVTDGRQAR